MTRLWLIRHAESAAAPGVAVGWSDPPLSEAGERHAAELAAQLAGEDLVRVYCSDLERARRTATLVAAPHSTPVSATPALRELNFGAWEGRRLGDLWHEEPEAAARWERDLRCTPPSFGESVADLEHRVEAFLRASLGGPPGPVVIVAHRGSLAAVRVLITGCDFASAWAEPCAPGSAAAVETERC